MCVGGLKVSFGNLKGSKMAHPAGFEPATYRLEGECSIQLSYGCMENLKILDICCVNLGPNRSSVKIIESLTY